MISAKENQLPDISPKLLSEKLNYANSTLPFLSIVVSEIDQLAQEHGSIRTRLGEIDSRRSSKDHDDVYSAEIRAVEQSADQLCDRLASCYQELDQIKGLSFDSATPKYVDFPLDVLDGTVHFCWKLGEKSVCHWHWSNEACDLRRPINDCERITGGSKSLLA